MDRVKHSHESGRGEFARQPNFPDPSQPWCSKCAKHTEGKEKIFNIFGGLSSRHSCAYACAECGKTMWAPASCKIAGTAAIVCLLFGLAAMAATFFAIRTHYGDLMTGYIIAAEGVMVLYYYVCCRVKQKHFEKFTLWASRKDRYTPKD